MNVDDAMEAAAAYLAHEQEGEPMFASEQVAITLAAEVIRLRAELTVEREAFKLLVNLRAEVLTKLAEAKAENVGLEESHFRLEVELAAAKANSEALKKALLEMQQAAIRLGDRLDDAEKELAGAKAASVCPVDVVDFEPDYEQTVTVALWTNADGQLFADWLRDRMKERGEGMNVDEAMAEVETTIRRNPRLFSSHYYEVASVLAKEVERLRAELKVADKWLHERSEAYGKTCSIVDQLQTELSAAKAASALPVEAVDCYTLGDDVEVVCKCSEDADCRR